MGKVIEVKRGNGGVSHIVFDRVRQSLENYLPEKERVIIITDSNLLAHYGDIITQYKHIVIGLGEEEKTLSMVEYIYSQLLEMEADRHSYILGFGGGIVTDIAGFAASTYQRGIRFGFVATSLLAQVDASVGGKNGVNFHGYKNMIGNFNQPDFVICDVEMLATLPPRELRAGLAEIIKAGVIKSAPLFELFENNSYEALTQNNDLLQSLIVASVEIKAAVVEADEREAGERKKLNFGHTLAHAIEKSCREFVHGEAVAIGMIMASDASLAMGLLCQEERNRIVAVIEKCGFTTESGVDINTLCKELHNDKKRNNDTIDFIFATKIGEAKVQKIGFEPLEALFK